MEFSSETLLSEINLENINLENINLENIKKLIIKCHNTALLKPDESLNAIIIYHIYSDGEITDEKGG